MQFSTLFAIATAILSTDAMAAATVCHNWSVTTSDGRSGTCTTKNNQNQICTGLGSSPFSVSIQALDPTGATSKIKLVSTTGVKANGEMETATGGPVTAAFKDGSGSASATLVSNTC